LTKDGAGVYHYRKIHHYRALHLCRALLHGKESFAVQGCTAKKASTAKQIRAHGKEA
jgi:hypothetical protein